MSVINKVLRDLDHRAAGGAGPPAADHAPAGDGTQMPPGVIPVFALPSAPPPVQVRRGRWMSALLLAALLMGVAALWWSQMPGDADAGPADPAVTPAPMSQAVPPPPTAVAQVESATAPAAASAQSPVAEASEALFPAGMARPEVLMQLPASVPVPAPVPPIVAPSLPTPAPVAAASASPAGVPAVAARQVQPVPAPAASAAYRMAGATPSAASASRSVEAEPSPAALPAPVPWPEAALDAVGQAQRMWSTGARDTALAFLRDALAGVERAHGADLLPDRAGATAGLAMVRELVRMEQVMANHAQVLALLKRHEVLWARQADLWAVRGSAAQRLSHHADAADSYRTALRLRPGEPRWMLGAAVSLAALGRLADATQLAEQARRSGPVSPEVLSYLRQLGVQLPSDNPGN